MEICIILYKCLYFIMLESKFDCILRMPKVNNFGMAKSMRDNKMNS